VLSVAEEFPHCVPVFLGCFDAGYVAAAGKHDQLGSGDGAGDRLGLGGAANEVKLAGHMSVGHAIRPSRGRRLTDWYRPPSKALPAARFAFMTRLISASLAATAGLSGSAR